MTAPHHLSFEEREASFWKQIEDKYGSLKGFENFVFKSHRKKSVVNCEIHGNFESNPHQLLSTKKAVLCYECSNKLKGERAAARDFEERKQAFKDRVVEKMGSYEGFQDFDFVNYNTKSLIHCPKHGTYSKIASHIFGRKHPCVPCQKDINENEYLASFMQRIGNKYGTALSFPEYTYKQASGKDMLDVVCPVHGTFKRTPSNILAGLGCNECQGRIPSKYTPESFKRKVVQVRGSDEGLWPTVYTGHKENVLIECSVHGVVPIYPSTLLSGGWCEQCSILARTKWTTDLAIQASKERFPGKLTYERSEYTGCLEKMTFTCTKHGDFKTLLDTHLRSASHCPGCAIKGYSDFKPGFLYVLQNKDLTKIGITNKTPTTRLRNINHQSGKGFELVKYFHFDDGSVPRKLETWALQQYRNTHKQPEEVFDGYTESFYGVDVEELLSGIDAKILEFPHKVLYSLSPICDTEHIR